MVSKLITLLNERPELIGEYLVSSSRIALILLDKQGIILDCNPFFMENVRQSQKPFGQSIEAFISDGFFMENDLSDGKCQPIKLTFSLNHSFAQSLAGHLIKVRDFYIILAHTFHLTDNELVTSMSKLTDELTNLTRELNKKNRELEVANLKVVELMNTDPLTGLINRRQLTKLLDNEMSKARRYNRPLSALMIDIDHFKSINDEYGHATGDDVLVKVSQALTSACRKEDIVARYGGEEFVVILPESPASSAMLCAEKIRKAIEDILCQEINRPVTASFGVTLFLKTDTEKTFIKRTDIALYSAKESGRNRVVSNF